MAQILQLDTIYEVQNVSDEGKADNSALIKGGTVDLYQYLLKDKPVDISAMKKTHANLDQLEFAKSLPAYIAFKENINGVTQIQWSGVTLTPIQ